MATHVLNQCPTRSNAFNGLSMGAQNFLFRLTNLVDRYGCYDARIVILRSFLFPLNTNEVTDEQVSNWLNECVNAGLVICYEVHGQPYLEIQGFRCRTGKIKTIIPQRRPEPEAVPDSTTEAATESPVYTPPVAEKRQPLPGKEHEFYLEELFKRENHSHLIRLCQLAREPILERSWIEAFNEHIRSEGKRYKVDYEWLDHLKKWLPLNIQRLLQQQNRHKPVYKQRPKPMVL